MPEYVLIKFEDNYADEFDVYGFVVTTKELYEAHKAKIKRLNREIEICFGTNESLSWSTPEEFLNSWKVSNLTDAEADVFESNFKSWSHVPGTRASFGMTHFFELEYFMDEYEFEDEDN